MYWDRFPQKKKKKSLGRIGRWRVWYAAVTAAVQNLTCGYTRNASTINHPRKPRASCPWLTQLSMLRGSIERATLCVDCVSCLWQQQITFHHVCPRCACVHNGSSHSGGVKTEPHTPDPLDCQEHCIAYWYVQIGDAVVVSSVPCRGSWTVCVYESIRPVKTLTLFLVS